MDLIDKNLVSISENLTNVFVVLIHLQEHGIFTDTEVNTIRNMGTDIEKNYGLLTLVKKKGLRVLSSFLKILRETGNSHIADLIEENAKKSELHYSPSTLKKITHQNVRARNVQLKSNPDEVAIDQPEAHKIKLLDGKWWPEKKILIKSFYDRKINGQLITEKLLDMLQESKNNSTVITQDTLVVSGLGGIGKTSIAKSYAIHFEKKYDHIIWIDCGEGSLSNSFKSLARDLNVQNRAEMSLKELARKSFSKLQEWKCLIIYDNAECFIGNEGIRDVLPKHKNLYAIITSRNQEWGTDTGYGKISKFCMNVFTEDDSLQFLKKYLKTNIRFIDSQLQKLGELLGHLPLALQIAVATLNNRRITLTKYIEQLAKEDVSDIIKKTFDDYEMTINKTMQISFDHIQNEEFGEIANNIIMVFGFLQPDDVDSEVFGSIETKSAAEIRNGVTVLVKYSLINMEKKLNPKSKREVESLNIHRLLQQVIRHNAKDQEVCILRKILLSNIDINNKLIPCFYADCHDDLKNEFSYIKSQLIFGNELPNLVKKRRYSDAVKLSMMINGSFDHVGSNKEYLTSKYNYAICLDKNEQEMESIELLKSILKELQEENVNTTFKRSLMLNSEGKLELKLKEVLDDDPTRFIIGLYLGLRERNVKMNTILEISMGELPCVDELVMVLILGLTVAKDNIDCHRPSEIEKLKDVVPKWEYQNGVLDFSLWYHSFTKLMDVALKLASNEEYVDVMTILFFVTRKFMFSIPFEDFQLIIFNGMSNNNDLFKSYQNMGKIDRYVTIVGDLFAVIKEESNNNILYEEPHELEEPVALAEISERTSFGSFFSGNFIHHDCRILATFPDPQLMTSLTLERTTIYLKDICDSLRQCTNLVRIVMKDNRFWGRLRHKVELPNLKHYELELRQELNEIGLDFMSRIDYFTFFGENDLCLWDTVSKLESYQIKFSQCHVEFTSERKQITLQFQGTVGISINREKYQHFSCICINCSNFGKFLNVKDTACAGIRNIPPIQQTKHSKIRLFGQLPVSMASKPKQIPISHELGLSETKIFSYYRKPGSRNDKTLLSRVLGKKKVPIPQRMHLASKSWLPSCESRTQSPKDFEWDGEISSSNSIEKNKSYQKVELIGAKFLNPDKQKSVPLNLFLTGFEYLSHLKIDTLEQVVDLKQLNYIDVVEIYSSKIICSSNLPNNSLISNTIDDCCRKATETNATRQTNFNLSFSVQSKRNRKLILNKVFPIAMVHDDEVKDITVSNLSPMHRVLYIQKDIDFSSLNVDELEWVGSGNDYILLDKLPSGIKQLTLENIKIKCAEEFKSNLGCPDGFLPSTFKTLALCHIELLMRIFPSSVQELRLKMVKLIGKIFDGSPLELTDLIIMDHRMEESERTVKPFPKYSRGTAELCIWERIRRLKVLKIKSPYWGVKFNSERQMLAFYDLGIEDNVRYCLFRKLRLENCIVISNSEENLEKCSCTNCTTNSHVYPSLFTGAKEADSFDYPKEIELIDTKVLDAKTLGIQPLNSFLSRFINLRHLKIINCEHDTNLMSLAHIEVPS